MSSRPLRRRAFYRLVCAIFIAVGLVTVADTTGFAGIEVSTATNSSNIVDVVDTDDSVGAPAVSTDAPRQDAAPGNQLPETGVPCDVLAVIGATLVLLGLALLGVGGRRRPPAMQS